MHHSYNLLEMGDEQWFEDAHGNRCVENQMIITPKVIIYFYANCPLRRVVKPKPHVLPDPKDVRP